MKLNLIFLFFKVWAQSLCCAIFGVVTQEYFYDRHSGLTNKTHNTKLKKDWSNVMTIVKKLGAGHIMTIHLDDI
jgi:hypothetical protein